MKKVFYPTKGRNVLPDKNSGAIGALKSIVLTDNEMRGKSDITIVCLYGEEAENENKDNKYTHYLYYKVPEILKKVNKIISAISRKVKWMHFLEKGDVITGAYFVILCAKNMRDNHYDQIVIDGVPALMWTLALFGNQKRYKNKVCYIGHNEVKHFCKSERLFSNCNKVVGVSNFIAEYFAKRTKIEEKCEVFSIKSPFDSICFIETDDKRDVYKSELKALYNLNDEKVVLYVGRIVEEKGVRELVNAVQNFSEDVVLIICGSSAFKNAQKEKFLQELEKTALEGKVRTIFTGYIDHENLKKYYALADVLVMPSKCNEAAGLVAIEALCNGTPVIASDVGGVREYLEGKACKLISIESLEESLLTELSCVLKDENLKKRARKEMNQNRKLFSIERYCDEFQTKVYGVE